MSVPLRIGLIVEGHGEYEAVRMLLQRIWYELLGGDSLDVARPFRFPQGTLLKEEGLKQAVDTVRIKLGPDSPGGIRALILILLDSEGKCPRELAPRLLAWAKEARTDADIACVLPHPMFETWFAAAAASLAGVNGLPANLPAPDDPEGQSFGKSWLRRQLPRKYSEPVDQPRFAARMDLAQCRARSPSFDKLCRELERRLTASRD
ncbi:hypothetical protein OJF2_06250 [Aquisphaera giovannonii]|uniref:DUF4276 domain-containing protein n=1 Tax=Aquisphaera giovannonii TaxID=406548 RepID=A0A5B9VUI7_9BACT|nr:DUF4276 family protein [Aquisphaera giovannonii]QEH32156.1 hypothetical protein OJF2_06250 [Aquisphaera giovannonii]